MSNHDKIAEAVEIGEKPWVDMRKDVYNTIAQMFAEILMGDLSKPVEEPEWYRKEHENDE